MISTEPQVPIRSSLQISYSATKVAATGKLSGPALQIALFGIEPSKPYTDTCRPNDGTAI